MNDVDQRDDLTPEPPVTASEAPAPPPPTAAAPPTGADTTGADGSAADRSRPSLLHLAFHPLIEPRTWLGTAQIVLDLFFGILWFTLVVTAFSTSLGLLITLVGFPLLLLSLLLMRAVSWTDRQRARIMLGVETDDPFRPMFTGTTPWAQLVSFITDPAGWKALAYSLVLLFWATLTFTVVITFWSLGLGGLTTPLWAWSVPIEIGAGWSVGGAGKAATIAGTFVVSVVFLILTPRLVHLIARVDGWLVRTLLGRDPTPELVERVEQLQVSRDASVEGAASELRRIERDLHDGAQQRLVGLAMELGLARERIERGTDPAEAGDLVAHAHEEAKRAISELRDLVRGIHPTVLTDRGLDAALSALAARSPVPVEVLVRVDDRPPAAIESAAYFVVAEALTNVAKHAAATRARVTVSVVEPAEGTPGLVLVVEISDDGRGGASVAEGGGLAGLRDRVLAVEGRIRIASPEGGPTIVVAELPYEPR